MTTETDKRTDRRVGGPINETVITWLVKQSLGAFEYKVVVFGTVTEGFGGLECSSNRAKTQFYVPYTVSYLSLSLSLSAYALIAVFVHAKLLSGVV